MACAICGAPGHNRATCPHSEQTSHIKKAISQAGAIANQCKAMTRVGRQCTRNPSENGYCWQHRWKSNGESSASSSTIVEAQMCKGTTVSGNPCKKRTRNTTGFCHLHVAQADGISSSSDGETSFNEESYFIIGESSASSSTIAEAQMCKGTTVSGNPCKKRTRNTTGFCHLHVAQAGRSPANTESEVKTYPTMDNRCQAILSSSLNKGEQCPWKAKIEYGNKYCGVHRGQYFATNICQAITKRGHRCKNPATNDFYCYHHVQKEITPESLDTKSTSSLRICEAVTHKGTRCKRAVKEGKLCWQHFGQLQSMKLKGNTLSNKNSQYISGDSVSETDESEEEESLEPDTQAIFLANMRGTKILNLDKLNVLPQILTHDAIKWWSNTVPDPEEDYERGVVFVVQNEKGELALDYCHTEDFHVQLDGYAEELNCTLAFLWSTNYPYTVFYLVSLMLQPYMDSKDSISDDEIEWIKGGSESLREIQKAIGLAGKMAEVRFGGDPQIIKGQTTARADT
eukprot:Nk52_evm42s163 gene=Nk52_evmTU42s163